MSKRVTFTHIIYSTHPSGNDFSYWDHPPGSYKNRKGDRLVIPIK